MQHQHEGSVSEVGRVWRASGSVACLLLGGGGLDLLAEQSRAGQGRAAARSLTGRLQNSLATLPVSFY